jgi:CelD/BcsL family acetyltransferase involved in cellulose biosynthesis
MPERIEIAIVRTREELAALAPQWRALCRHDPHSTPFQSPEWLLPWARQFARRDLRALTIGRDGSLIGLVPAYVYTEQRRRERQILLLGAGTSDYLDGIFAPECTTEHVRAALDCLHAESGWDVAYFTQLRPGSKLMHALETLRGLQAEPVHSQTCMRMPAVRIAELPTKLRHNVHYYRNRGQRRGMLEVRTAGLADCREGFEVLRRLHADRWQRAGQPGVLADPRILAWHREALPLLANSGMLRLVTLMLNGEAVASIYALIDPPWRRDRTLYVYLPAFSVRHADLRPGTLLLAHVIDQAAQEGVRAIDLLRGEEAYKHLWHGQRFPTFGYSLRRADSLARAA